MAQWTAVQIAEFVSRKRAYGGAVSAVLFVALAILAHPPLLAGQAPVRTGVIDWWAIYAAALLGLVATGGGLLWNRRIRALVNDEVARAHQRTAMVAGYWVAGFSALAVYVASRWIPFSGRGSAYLILTPSVVVPLLVFAYLEHRSLGDE